MQVSLGSPAAKRPVPFTIGSADVNQEKVGSVKNMVFDFLSGEPYLFLLDKFERDEKTYRRIGYSPWN